MDIVQDRLAVAAVQVEAPLAEVAAPTAVERSAEDNIQYQ